MLSRPPVTPAAAEEKHRIWSLYLISLTLQEKIKIWEGPLDQYPTSAELSKILPVDILPEQLMAIAIDVIKFAPAQVICGLLQTLSCVYRRSTKENIIDVDILHNSDQKKSVCGAVFKKGDIVWTCRQCGKDTTCVQCDPCFRKSDHSGHEVYFHRASGDSSGCCDCGDAEAWATTGNCCDHRGNQVPDSHVHLDPNIARGLDAVARAAAGMIISFSVCTIRGFQPWESNPFVSSKPPGPIIAGGILVGRLHNDDIHTYDEVTRALIDTRLFHRREAAELTAQVDKDGECIIFNTEKFNPSILRVVSAALRSEKLLCSVTPQDVANFQPRLVALFTFLLSVGLKGDALRRVIVKGLLAKSSELLPPSVDFLASVCDPALGITPGTIHSPSQRHQFPYSIPQLQSLEVQNLSLKQRTLLSSISGEENFGREFLHHIMHPFDSSECNCLGILVIASSFFTKIVKKLINEVIIKFQHDYLFKYGFSQLLTVLYPTVYALHYRHIGTEEKSILQTSVQLYTANSIITLMSSDGIDSRPLDEKKPIQIAKMMTSTILAILHEVGCIDEHTYPKDSSFLNHHSIRTSRISHICRDMEYLSYNVLHCSRMLCDEVDAGVMDDWIQIIARLQYIDCYKREVAAHVEMDSELWQIGLTLVMELESVSKNFISHALYDMKDCDDTISAADAEDDNGSFTLPLPKPNELKLALSSSYSNTIAENDTPLLATSNNEKSGHFVTNLPETTSSRLRLKVVSSITGKVMIKIHEWCSIQRGLEQGTGVLNPFDGDFSEVGYVLSSAHDHVSPSSSTLRLWDFYLTPPANSATSFKVSSNFVSVHIPLHRMVAKVVQCAAFSNISLSSVIDNWRHRAAPATGDHQRKTIETIFFLAEYPLRCASFAAQVHAGMWRRNGGAVINLVYNYTLPPFSKTFRTFDLVAIQFAILLASSPDVILMLMIDRMELRDYLNDLVGFYRRSKDTDDSFKPQLLSELLRLLIHLVMHPPTTLTIPNASSDHVNDARNHPQYFEGLRTALSRELVHQILGSGSRPSSTSGSITMGKLMERTKRLVGLTGVSAKNDISDNLLSAVIADVTEGPTEGGVDRGKSLQIKPQAHLYFDPEYPNLYYEESNVAAEKMKQRARSVSSEGANSFRPLFYPEAIVKPNYDFYRVRYLVYGPVFLTLLQSALRLSSLDYDSTDITKKMTQDTEKLRFAIIGRVLYLVTLQIYFHHELVDSPSSNGSHGRNYFAEDFSAPTGSSSGGNAFPLLRSLTLLWKSDHLLKGEEELKSALGWILKQLSDRSAHAKSYLESQGVFLSDSQGSDEKPVASKDSLEAGKKYLAQQKAMASMQANAKAFAAFAIDLDSDDESEMEHDAAEGDDQVGKKSIDMEQDTKRGYEMNETLGISIDDDECIICRGKGIDTDSLSYLCFLQPSKVLRNLTQCDSNASIPQINYAYRVVNSECSVYKSKGENSALISLLKYGTHVIATERVGRWVHISAPTKGWCQIYGVIKVPASSKIADEKESKVLKLYLHPIRDLQWLRHGSTRTHVSACGHAMHMSCWDTLYATQCSKFYSSMASEHVALNIQRGELLCPFCRTVSNSLLPKLPDVSFPFQNNEVREVVDTSQPLAYVRLISEGRASALDLFMNNNTNTQYRQSIQQRHEYFLRCLSQSSFVDGLVGVQSYLQIDSFLSATGKVAAQSPLKSIHHELQYVYATWSAVAYTLLLATVNQIRSRNQDTEIGSSQSSLLVQLQKSDQIVLYHSMRYLRKVPSFFEQYADLGKYCDLIAKPLCATLFRSAPPLSASTGISSAHLSAYKPGTTPHTLLKYALGALPHHSLWSTNETSIPSLDECQNLLVAGLGEKNAEAGTTDADLLDLIFPIFQSPLLSQDLHIFFVAMATASTDFDSYNALSSIICAARLVQVLIEPACTGHSPPSSTSKALSEAFQHGNAKRVKKNGPDTELTLTSDVVVGVDPELVALAEEMITLRNTVCHDAGVPVVANTLSAVEIVDAAIDAWIPFLEFAFHLKTVMLAICGQSQQSAPDSFQHLHEIQLKLRNGGQFNCSTTSDAKIKFRHAMSLCTSLDVPAVPELSHNSNLRGMVGGWCGHFRQFVGSAQATDPVKLVISEDDHSAGGNLKGCDESEFAKSSSSISSASMTNKRGSGYHGGGSGGGGDGYVDSVVDSFHDLEMMTGSQADANNNNNNDEVDDNYNVTIEGDFDMMEDIIAQQLAAEMSLFQGEKVSNPSKSVQRKWKLVGVDPSYSHEGQQVLFLDEVNNVAKIALHGSVSGTAEIVDHNGTVLANPYPDLSHMGFGLKNIKGPLISMPYTYTDLYQKAKFVDDVIIEDPAICLVCGRVISAGNRSHKASRSGESIEPGECTLHARSCAGGVGIFYLLQQFTVLLVRDSRCCYYPQLSLYLDSSGEVSQSRSQNRPMFLSSKRYKQVENLYLSHSIAKEVVRTRSMEERYIRQFYY